MKKYLIILISLAFTTSCLSSTITSDVSLSHDFNLPQFSDTDSSITATVQDCYSPNTADIFNKISGNSSDLSWNISKIEATLDLGVAASDFISASVLIEDQNNKNSILLNSNDMVGQGPIVTLSSTKIDSQLLTNILNSTTMQVCASVTGNNNIMLPSVTHGVLSFHLDADFDKSL